MNPVWVVVGIIVGLHVVLVPVFLIANRMNQITIPPEAKITLPAVATSPKPKTQVIMAAIPGQMHNYNTALPGSDGLKIEKDHEGLITVTIPRSSALYESESGQPDSWKYVGDYLEGGQILVEPEQASKFWSIKPIANPYLGSELPMWWCL